MDKLVTYVCGMCLQEVEADSAMPHLAGPHFIPQTEEEVRAGKDPEQCSGVGFPTKKNIMETPMSGRRPPQTPLGVR